VSAPRFGCNTFIWRSPFSTETDLDVIDHVADLGGEVVEVAVEDLRLVDGAKVAEAARRRGLGVVVCGAFGPERDVGSADPAVRERTLAYLVGLLDLAVAAGADLVVGPAYGSVGLARPLPAEERRAERDRVVGAMREVAVEAGRRGVRVGLEPLDRFETDRRRRLPLARGGAEPGRHRRGGHGVPAGALVVRVAGPPPLGRSPRAAAA
jgi:D-psicose/D-tagatose/L-ribulose 3-epimerase